MTSRSVADEYLLKLVLWRSSFSHTFGLKVFVWCSSTFCIFVRLTDILYIMLPLIYRALLWSAAAVVVVGRESLQSCSVNTIGSHDAGQSSQGIWQNYVIQAIEGKLPIRLGSNGLACKLFGGLGFSVANDGVDPLPYTPVACITGSMEWAIHKCCFHGNVCNLFTPSHLISWDLLVLK